MPREYGAIHTTFWTSGTTHEFSDDGKLLSLYLLTGPHSTALGCFRLPDGYVMEDLRWSSERVTKAFSELSAKGFANRCETTKWVLIRNYLKFNPPENPNQRKSLRRLAEQVPDVSGIKNELNSLINQYCGPAQQLSFIDETKANIENPSETVTQTLSKSGPGPGEGPGPEPEPEKTESSGERLNAPPTSPVVARLILLNKTFHEVRECDVEKWSAQYPAVNVRVELGKMAGWLEGNPTNRKTPRGILAFIHRWLSRTQDEAPKFNGNGARPSATKPLSASERQRRRMGQAK